MREVLADGREVAEERYSTQLRLRGDDLDPEYVTEIIGVAPTTANRRGELMERPIKPTPHRTGSWQLAAPDVSDCHHSETLERQIHWLLEQCTGNLENWKKLAELFEIDLFIGIHIGNTLAAFGLEPQTMRLLAERGIVLDCHLYCGSEGLRLVEGEDIA
ncbi:MAG: DUF4279 domain-containing protein [Pseudomonadota bacterium]